MRGTVILCRLQVCKVILLAAVFTSNNDRNNSTPLSADELQSGTETEQKFLSRHRKITLRSIYAVHIDLVDSDTVKFLCNTIIIKSVQEHLSFLTI